MDKLVHYHCLYTYDRKGKIKTASYQSPKRSYNATNPTDIIRVLRDEIKRETGRIVIDFLIVGKVPANQTILN